MKKEELIKGGEYNDGRGEILKFHSFDEVGDAFFTGIKTTYYIVNDDGLIRFYLDTVLNYFTPIKQPNQEIIKLLENLHEHHGLKQESFDDVMKCLGGVDPVIFKKK